jgi:hypothetical protein
VCFTSYGQISEHHRSEFRTNDHWNSIRIKGERLLDYDITHLNVNNSKKFFVQYENAILSFAIPNLSAPIANDSSKWPTDRFAPPWKNNIPGRGTQVHSIYPLVGMWGWKLPLPSQASLGWNGNNIGSTHYGWNWTLWLLYTVTTGHGSPIKELPLFLTLFSLFFFQKKKRFGHFSRPNLFCYKNYSSIKILQHKILTYLK